MHSTSSAPLPPDLQHAMQMAAEYQRGGRPAEAAALYRQFLARYPQHPILLGQLGALQMQLRDFQAALPLLEQARASAPGNALHWLMLTECLLELGRAKDAKKVISEAINKGLRHPMADELLRRARTGKKKPEKAVPLKEALRQLDKLLQAGRYVEVERLGRELRHRNAGTAQIEYLLGMAALLQGRPQDATPLLRHAVELDPRMAPALYNLGFVLEGQGCLEEALEMYRRAVTVAPQLADAHNNLGNVLQGLKRPEEALAAYGRAVALRAEAGCFHMNRGDVLREMGRLDEAIDAYMTALRRQPELIEAYVSLALVLFQLGRYEESLQACQSAIERRPEYFEAYQAMGHALRRLDRDEEAAAAYRRCVELKPHDAAAHKDLAAALRNGGQHEAALETLQQALVLQPDFEAAINMRAALLLDMGRHAEGLDAYRRGLALKPDGFFNMHGNLLLALNYQAGGTADMLLAEARAFGEKAARKAAPFLHHDNLPDPSRRLRVGLVSGDLGQHPVGFFLQSVLESLDPSKTELFAYATADRKDALNERLRRSIPHWRDASVAKMSDEALASQIRADGIDILVDLAGPTAKNRLPVFAWKPAPVQVAWLGYFATTGLTAMDYIIADRWVLPTAEEAHFVETPWRLPDAYYCFSPPNEEATPAPLPALRNDGVTFGCFNNPSKLNGEVIACWARVLEAVPGSRLMLKYKGYADASLRERICRQFGAHGIPENRLLFSGQSARSEYLEAYNQVDIALDPYPFPGGTTTIEGLWMGVPVITLRGHRFVGHQGETILHNVGLPEWIAADADDYVAKAVAFAGNVQDLAALRAGLRERLLASPLCDARRFARNFEAALRGMWQKWCAQQQAPSEAG